MTLPLHPRTPLDVRTAVSTAAVVATGATLSQEHAAAHRMLDSRLVSLAGDPGAAALIAEARARVARADALVAADAERVAAAWPLAA